MSNLGNYQRMVELAKAADGPAKLAIYVVAGSVLVGTVIGTFAGPAIKQGVGKVVQTATRKRKNSSVADRPVYSVKADADGESGLILRAGDEFRVLSHDGDAILIEVLQNKNNPHVVSGMLLREISDFKVEGD